MKVWILTSEQNAWDQFGEYFVAVFGVKPDHTQLGLSGVPTNRLRHTLNGGGRVDDEDKWFHLRLHETQALRGTVRSSSFELGDKAMEFVDALNDLCTAQGVRIFSGSPVVILNLDPSDDPIDFPEIQDHT